MPWPTENTPEERSDTRRRLRDQRTRALREALPDNGQLIGSLIEIGKPVSFTAAHQDDPKPLLKKVLPTLGRHVQCLHPVTRTAKPDAKKNGAKPSRTHRSVATMSNAPLPRYATSSDP